MTRSPYDPTPAFYPEPWEDKAACLKEDPDLFFREDQASIDKAKAVCAGCPAANDCLLKGMLESHGIFGGLTADERKALRNSKTVHAVSERRAAISQLHSRGLNDREIGDALGITRQAVQSLRAGLGLVANTHVRAS